MASTEERLSRIEGGYEHLATKADLESLRGELTAGMSNLEARLIKWMVGTQVGLILGLAGLLFAAARLFGAG